MHYATETVTTDDALELLANHERRQLLVQLAGTRDRTATIDELVASMTDDSTGRGKHPRDEANLRTELHHRHLPHLVAEGVVEYEADAEVVRYRANPKVDELLEFVSSNMA